MLNVVFLMFFSFLFHNTQRDHFFVGGLFFGPFGTPEGEQVEQVGLLVHPALPWLGASPDGVSWDATSATAGPGHLIEIKSCRSLLGKKSPAWHQAGSLDKACEICRFCMVLSILYSVRYVIMFMFHLCCKI